MEILNNKDKLSTIIGIRYAYANEASTVDYPGQYIKCVGTFTELRYSLATFVESDVENGSPVDQELSIIVRGQSEESDTESIELGGKYLLLMLIYTNDTTKIVGTPDNPVVLSVDNSESPVQTKLYTKRISAERAKYLLV